MEIKSSTDETKSPSNLPSTQQEEKRNATPRRPSRFFTEYYSSAILLLIAIFFGIAYFSLRPLIFSVKQINAEITQHLETLHRTQGYLTSLEQSIAASQAISPVALDLVNRALPSESNLPLLLVQFGAAAAQHNIKIGSLSFTEGVPFKQIKSNFQKSTSTESIVPLEISLTVNTQSYVELKRFLAELETNLRLMDIIGLATSAGTEKESTYQLQLRTYLFGATKGQTSFPAGV